MNEVYKIKKGDTLSGISKKFGHLKWEIIWNAPENRVLLSKRKKPEAIQPGDQLIIPPNEKEQKEANNLLQQTKVLQQSLTDQSARLRKQISVYDEMIKYHNEITEQVLKELEDSLKGIKKWAKGVDTAAEVAKSIFDHRKAITKIGSLGKNAIGVHGAELKKIAKEVMEEAKDIGKDQAKDKTKAAAIKFLSEHKESSNALVAAAAATADSFEKISSPSFWANTAVNLLNGKGWSEAVTSEVGEEIEERIKIFKAQSAKQLKNLESQQNQLKGQLQEAQVIVKSIGRQIKEVNP